MTKKKILFIYGPLNGGGAERVLLDIFNNYDYSNNEVHLCQICAGGKLLNELPKAVISHSMWPDYTLGYKLAYRASMKLGWNSWLRRRYHKVMDKFGSFDVVISFLEGMPLRMHYLFDIKEGTQVTWVHVDLLRFPYTDNQFRKGEQIAAYNKMDKVVCVAQDTERAFKQRFPNCTSQTTVIYNPIDIKKIEKMSLEHVVKNERFTIVMMGRITPQKRSERFVQVARRFKDMGYRDVLFQWIGDGELRTDMEQLIHELDVEDMVEILGFHHNPFPYLKAADMMFCCSGFEGFCLAICEAMVLGVPVVSTKTSGPIEILDNNQYGFLCEHNIDSMVHAVLTMYNDVSLREHYSELGRQRVKKYEAVQCMQHIYEL